MKKLHQLLIMLLLSWFSTTVEAQNFHVLDINKSQDANPTNNTIFEGYDWGRMDTYYAIYNGISYFSADDGVHGPELWRSDGTSAGTYLLKDINPGSNSSNIHDIIVSGGKIYFTASDGTSPQTIWITDGTAGGTKKVADLNSSSLNPTYLTDVNGTLYFFTDGFYYGYYTLTASQLWKTDGTALGTQLVADFYSPEFNYANGARQITNVNGRVFFSLANYGWDNELYTSDGTAAGTRMINGINPYGNSNPTYLTSFNGLLFFSANSISGTTLWQSDGSDVGTHAVNNVNNIYLDNNTVMRFTIKDNSIFFTGYINDGNGTKFCKYDASSDANSVEMVKDINPGVYCYNLYNITNVNGTLFFTVYNGSDQVLYKSDGTTTGTMLVKNINPGGHNVYLYKHFENANGILLFSFYDDQHGYELWKSDGTYNGTSIVKEVNPGVYSAAVTNISYLKNNVSLFEAYDGKTGLELWRTDGTEAGTRLVKIINQTTTASSNPVWLTPALDNKSLAFSAYDPEFGHEMRITDGTESGTRIIKDIYKGSFDSWPYLPVSMKKSIYFFANIDNPLPQYSDDVHLVSRFWKSDGTDKGTTMLSVPPLENLINQYGYVVSLVSTEELVYLLLFNNSTYAYELWRSDGTSEGTFAIKTDIGPYYNPILTSVDKTLYFTNYDFSLGYGLWQTDGTTAGTQAIPLLGGSYPQNFCSFKGKLYFTAYDLSYNNDLWVSDGSSLGTKIISTVDVANWIPFALANGKLFFTANNINTTAGYELWATDGSQLGTRLVKDIDARPYYSTFPSLLTGAGSLLFFTATDSAHGYELWKSDGTARGTQLVKDITPGVNGTYSMHNLMSAGDRLFFLNNDALWTSDGTYKGTGVVNDRNISLLSGLGNLTGFGDKLCFTAYSNIYGSEMWVGNINNCDSYNSNQTQDKPAVTKEDINASANIYPNPVSNLLNVKIVAAAESRINLIITDVEGNTLKTHLAVPGVSSTAVDVSNLTPGTYFLKVISSNSKENVVLKFVKM